MVMRVSTSFISFLSVDVRGVRCDVHRTPVVLTARDSSRTPSSLRSQPSRRSPTSCFLLPRRACDSDANTTATPSRSRRSRSPIPLRYMSSPCRHPLSRVCDCRSCDHHTRCATQFCNDYVNIPTREQALCSDRIDVVNDCDTKCLRVSIVHVHNDPPLRAPEGGIDVRLCTRGAKREGHLTLCQPQTTYEEAHAA